MRSTLFFAFIFISNLALADCPRPKQTVALSAGEVVKLPLCAENAQLYAISGSADLEKTNAFLKNEGLYAVPIDGKAYVQIGFADYSNGTTIGPYKEAFIGIAASRKEGIWGGKLRYLEFFSFLNLGHAPTKFGIYLAKLWVTSDLALRAGNEIWGMNKELADIQIEKTDAGKATLKIKALNGDSILSADWKAGVPTKKIFGGQRFNFYNITPKEPKQTWARSRQSGKAYEQAITIEDHMTINVSEPWGAMLQTIGFAADTKRYVPSFSFEFHLGRRDL